MKSYYRIMLGKGGSRAEECQVGGYIGGNFSIDQDLAGKLPDNWRVFNKEFIPIWLSKNPDKSKVAAGLACGNLWTISKGILKGDIVICPSGGGRYLVGEVVGDYYFVPGPDLPHRRKVEWLQVVIDRNDMSDALKNSTGSIGTVSNITSHSEELEKFIGGTHRPVLVSTDNTVEDPSMFALEKHLEDFLVENRSHTELGKKYDIYTEDGEIIGQQYLSDTGPIDILAVSKDRKELLVVELKKGRVSDVVVGQVLRYMGYVKEELAEQGQTVKGIIIGSEDDLRIRRALSETPNITFFRYKVNFQLISS